MAECVFGDIYSPSDVYTQESMKAYKSLYGYNFFASGHVQEVMFSEVSDESPVCIPSPSVTMKPGLHHLCTLYMQSLVTPKTIDEIDFSKPKRKVLKKQTKPAVESDEDDLDVSSVFSKLRQIDTSACVLLKDDSETDSASEDDDLPPLLQRCWNLEDSLQGNVDNNYSLLMRNFTVTELQAQNLEVVSRGQHESPVLHRQRQGRITASFVHDLKTLKDHTSRTSIVNKILKIDQKKLKNVEAVKFGLTNETVAKKHYEENMVPMHDNFCIRESGLVVDTTCPFFAATPDGVRDCSYTSIKIRE